VQRMRMKRTRGVSVLNGVACRLILSLLCYSGKRNRSSDIWQAIQLDP